MRACASIVYYIGRHCPSFKQMESMLHGSFHVLWNGKCICAGCFHDGCGIQTLHAFLQCCPLLIWQLIGAASLNVLAGAGTYHYMAPEMIRHEMYDSRADVYSWGVLFAEILQQQPPYEGLYCTPVQVHKPCLQPLTHRGSGLRWVDQADHTQESPAVE